MTGVQVLRTNGVFERTSVYAILSYVIVGLVITFLLGIGNFALHSAVLQSGHPLLEQMPDFIHLLGGRLSLVAEFLVLLSALLLVANGWVALAWAYGGYSTLNAISAWLILNDRV
ncbi:MAG: hypothetical protein AAFY42_00850 [Pseudomonadota bacterium]